MEERARSWLIFRVNVSLLLEEGVSLWRDTRPQSPLFTLVSRFSCDVHGITGNIHKTCQYRFGYISFHINISCRVFIILNS
jgi:hypothetical protein